ncbi:MAG: hypothetical protein ABW168_07380 [Sedimenticola sp.]
MITPWAWPLYLLYMLYMLVTFLIGMVLLEHQSISPDWTSGITLGVLGPTLFKTQAKIFKPIAGNGGINANLEQVMHGIQQFCFVQITTSLSYQRLAHKTELTHSDVSRLEKQLQALYGDDEFQSLIKPLIDERRTGGFDRTQGCQQGGATTEREPK